MTITAGGRVIALLILLAGLCTGQTVLFQPWSQSLSSSALGSGTDLTIWQITVELPPGTTRQAASILMLAPGITAIPNAQAEALLMRKAYRDPRTTLVRMFAAIQQLAPLGLTAAGIVTGTPAYTWAGFSISAGSILLPGLKNRAPDATLVPASSLLPDLIATSGKWFVVSPYVSGATHIGPVKIP